MTEINYHRQLSLVNPESLKVPICVIGAGGIGSMTIIQLAKMGATDITVYDMDTVEEHNLPNSFFVPQLIGKNKAIAINSLVYMFTGKQIIPITEKYEGQSLAAYKIVIAAPDNMETRQAIWERVKHTDKLLYIDARMSAEFMDLYFIDPNNKSSVDLYEAHTLKIKNKDTLQETCTAKAIIYNTAGIGSLICNAVKRAVSNQPNPIRVMMDYQTLVLEPVSKKENPVTKISPTDKELVEPSETD
jgi:hypothetical protein